MEPAAPKKRTSRPSTQKDDKNEDENDGGADDTDKKPAKRKYKKKPKGFGERPKKATTAYGFFIKENSKKQVDEIGGTAINAIKVISAQWQAMTEEQRKPYWDLYTEDKKRWARELEEMNANDGKWTDVRGKSHFYDLKAEKEAIEAAAV